MNCPYCKKRINHVYVVSEWSQKAYLEGYNVEGIYEEPEPGRTLRIECPKCNKDISHIVKEA
jgi:hypothetical protein